MLRRSNHRCQGVDWILKLLQLSLGVGDWKRKLFTKMKSASRIAWKHVGNDFDEVFRKLVSRLLLVSKAILMIPVMWLADFRYHQNVPALETAPNLLIVK